MSKRFTLIRKICAYRKNRNTLFKAISGDKLHKCINILDIDQEERKIFSCDRMAVKKNDCDKVARNLKIC